MPETTSKSYESFEFSLDERKRMNELINKSMSVFKDNVFIGFSGAHRTGKTTLAKEFADRMRLPFLETNIANVSIWEIFNPHDYLTFAERIEVQGHILETIQSIFKEKRNSKSLIVTDRTPIDVLAYLFANIDQTTSQLFDSRVSSFIKSCQILTMKYFSKIFVIQPAISFEKLPNKNGKVYNSFAYQVALTHNILGALTILKQESAENDSWNFHLIPQDIISLPKRVDFCVKILK